MVDKIHLDGEEGMDGSRHVSNSPRINEIHKKKI